MILKGVLTLLVLSGQASLGPDTVRIQADNPPVWGNSPSLVEVTRIGVLDGDENEVLGMVGGVGRMPDGSVWISDKHLGAIRRFSEAGQYLGLVGRRGEGPGEFLYPADIRIHPDESVLVWDPGRLRVSRFDTAGHFLDSFTPPTIMVSYENLPDMQVDSAGHVYVLGLDREPDGSPRSLFWIRMLPDGEVLDSVPILGSKVEGSMDPIRTHTTLSPLGYRIVGRNNDYALDLLIGGGTVRRIEMAWTPIRYRREEGDEKRRLERGFSERNGLPVRRIPTTKPPYSAFQVDSQGRIWVHMYAAGLVEAETPGERALREKYKGLLREWRQPFVCEVIEPDGRFLGRVRFPNRQTSLAVAYDRDVWVVEKGRYDEPYVVHYRIENGE